MTQAPVHSSSQCTPTLLLNLDMWGVTPSDRWDWAGLRANIALHGKQVFRTSREGHFPNFHIVHLPSNSSYVQVYAIHCWWRQCPRHLPHKLWATMRAQNLSLQICTTEEYLPESSLSSTKWDSLLLLTLSHLTHIFDFRFLYLSLLQFPLRTFLLTTRCLFDESEPILTVWQSLYTSILLS